MQSKKIKVSVIGLPDYLTKFGDLRTPLSDFYIKSKNCRILGACDDEGNAKGLLVEEIASVYEILFLAAENEDAAVKKALLDSLIKKIPAGMQVRWRISSSPENEKLAAGIGFLKESMLNIFRTIGFHDEKIAEVYKKNRRLYEFMEKRGYRTVCFDELTEEELMQIKKNPDKEFEASLHPERMMNGGAGSADGKLSFASIKDGKVAAYDIIRYPGGKQCIFEIVCVAASKRNSGVFILPVAASFEAMRICGAESVLFAVYEKNQKMLDLLKKQYAQYIRLQSVQHNFIYYKNK